MSYSHRQEGRRFSVRVEPLREAGSGIRGTVGVAVDVTEQEESEARLRQVIDLVPHFIFAKDAEGRFVLVNRAVAEAYGTTVDALLGKGDADSARSEAEVRHFREDDLEVIRSGRPMEAMTDASGHVRYLQTTKIPFAISGTASPAVLGVSLDITERKAAEEALRRAAKEESLTVLAGGVAHDFNNLLAAMLGHFVPLALRKLPAASPAREHVEKAATAIARAADLTRQMLAYSGRGHFVIQPATSAPSCARTCRCSRSPCPRPVGLDCHLAPELPLVDADVGQIQQVLMNLVINGAEAIGERGGRSPSPPGCTSCARATTASAASRAAPRPGALRPARSARRRPGHRTRRRCRASSTPFFSTKFTGRGLGLAAVLGIVKGHRAGSASTARPAGAPCLRLVFAPERGASLPPPRPCRRPPARGSGCCSSTTRTSSGRWSRSLEHEGLEVLTAADGEQGIALIRRDAQEIDAVLLDLSMPGLAARRRSRGSPPSAPSCP